MNFIKRYLNIFLMVLAFLLGMYSCQKLTESTQEKTTEKTVEETSDTIKVHTVDTVTQHKTIVKRPEPDTVIKYKRPNKDYHTVENKYSDDTLSIETNTDLKGKFLDQRLKYELKLPTQTITKTDSTIITDSVMVTKNHYPDPWELDVGINMVGSKNHFDFGPQIGVSKSNWGVGYSYDVLGENHRIYITRTIPITN